MGPCLTHIALQVEDIDRQIRFFTEYCGMAVVHERGRDSGRIIWMAEPGREKHFIFVLMGGGTPVDQAEDDYGHLGFAMESREAVDAIAARAREEGSLVWPPRDEPWPVGYYCGVRDPDGRFVEFSYGQPLGPGAPSTGTSTP